MAWLHENQQPQDLSQNIPQLQAFCVVALKYRTGRDATKKPEDDEKNIKFPADTEAAGLTDDYNLFLLGQPIEKDTGTAGSTPDTQPGHTAVGFIRSSLTQAEKYKDPVLLSRLKEVLEALLKDSE